MLTSSTGMAWSMSCRQAWTSVTAATVIGEPVTLAIARCSRESACRWAAGVRGLVDLGQRRGEQHAVRRRSASRLAAT